MKIRVFENSAALSRAAARMAAATIREAIEKKGQATFVAATGASQFEFLEFLTADKEIDWSKTTMFHLDEYVGLPETHKASFRKYLRERFIAKTHPGTVHLINGDAPSAEAEAERLNRLISGREIDIAFVGVGENGHLAFNDPPADFETHTPFLVLELDERCRLQQVNEGWFDSIDLVPRKAISMSVNEILRADTVVCCVPGERKAEAVKNCFDSDLISPQYPSSILKKHKRAYIFLDKSSAFMLSPGRYSVA
ncbi:MAG TPA: glucosamine-6-phosphate deaminase [Caldithrix abyssi]|uniref:Glucosamine-6-phosphate deaminase n=1 Tax=Caldithrix abyssi TaxID=187145 RepID=A0A7V1LP20_CALAY|nr:glucosamine-6-phosphate deaminase [Caldithrix abyssi]